MKAGNRRPGNPSKTLEASFSRRVSFSSLLHIARKHNLDLAGFLDIDEARAQLRGAVPHLEEWREAGFAGEMEYMRRGRELYSGFDHIMHGARSVLLFLVPYAAPGEHAGETPPGFGRVARYAWGRDYHRELKQRLWQFVDEARHGAGPGKTRVFSDAVPLLERTLAQRAGLGFIGKNTLLIRPGVGSFTFIAEVVWDVDIERDVESEYSAASAAAGSGCGTCERCLRRCPTGAFVGPGRLDARRCISYLTIEKRTAFSDEEASAIGDWVFGCDVCQEVCPFNHAETRGKVPAEFSPESGTGKVLELAALLRLSEIDFAARFQHTALMRAGRAGLVRNACAVAANSGFCAALDDLHRLAAEDPSPVVRTEARRSVNRLCAKEFVEKSPDLVLI